MRHLRGSETRRHVREEVPFHRRPRRGRRPPRPPARPPAVPAQNPRVGLPRGPRVGAVCPRRPPRGACSRSGEPAGVRPRRTPMRTPGPSWRCSPSPPAARTTAPARPIRQVTGGVRLGSPHANRGPRRAWLSDDAQPATVMDTGSPSCAWARSPSPTRPVRRDPPVGWSWRDHEGAFDRPATSVGLFAVTGGSTGPRSPCGTPSRQRSTTGSAAAGVDACEDLAAADATVPTEPRIAEIGDDLTSLPGILTIVPSRFVRATWSSTTGRCRHGRTRRTATGSS